MRFRKRRMNLIASHFYIFRLGADNGWLDHDGTKVLALRMLRSGSFLSLPVKICKEISWAMWVNKCGLKTEVSI